MLEKAYMKVKTLAIDSLDGLIFLWELHSEKFLKKAVQLMPMDPIVNDHYGDILGN